MSLRLIYVFGLFPIMLKRAFCSSTIVVKLSTRFDGFFKSCMSESKKKLYKKSTF